MQVENGSAVDYPVSHAVLHWYFENNYELNSINTDNDPAPADFSMK